MSLNVLSFVLIFQVLSWVEVILPSAKLNFSFVAIEVQVMSLTTLVFSLFGAQAFVINMIDVSIAIAVVSD